MTSYLVSYDLKAPDKDYDKVIDYLKSHDNYWHHLGSTWIIVTSLSAVELRDGIREHIDSNDKVLITQISGTWAWCGFSEAAGTWIKNNLSG